MAGLALHILFSLLDDAFTVVDVSDLNDRLNASLASLNSVEATHLPDHIVGATVSELLLLEKAASILISHGLPLAYESTCDVPVPLSGGVSTPSSLLGNEYFIDAKQLMNHLLNGITISVQYEDGKAPREKVFWLAPTCTRLCWETRRSSRIRSIPVTSIEVGVWAGRHRQEVTLAQGNVTQEIHIITTHNYGDITSTKTVNPSSRYTLTLILTSLPETRKLHFFLLCLCQWIRASLCSFSQEVAEMAEQDRIVFDSIMQQHSVPLACQNVVASRQARLCGYLNEEVKGRLTPQPVPKEEPKDDLTRAFEGRVPRVLLKLVRKLKELKSCDVKGVFRESGDTAQRDSFLDQIDSVGESERREG